jgi:energy-coupling factor transport system ATP-binding protein
MSAVITLENVSWAYARAREWALKNISLTIGEGEFIAVMGENGSGKTSFCRLLNGLIPHSLPGKLLGAVTIDGVVTAHTGVAQLARKAGTVFDDPRAQLFTARADDEVAFALENMCMPPAQIRERTAWALSAAGLSAYADRAPSTLSGGQQQRLAIAAALAMAEKILVLDEPASQLDPDGAREVLSLIRDLRARKGLTVVMATNSSTEAAEFAGRVCVLKNGRLAACDTPQRIFADQNLLDACGIDVPLERHHTEAQRTQRTQRIQNKLRDDNMKTTFSSSVSSVVSVPPCESLLLPPCLQIEHLYYQYNSGNMILNDINLAIGENDFTVITGRNGCGKTTLLKNISGLLRPTRGSILLRGRDTAQMGVAEIAGEIGFVMQDPDRQLFESTVYDEAAFALKRTMKGRALRDKVEEALSAVGLLDKREHFPLALGRADRVKTVFAGILAMGPRIIMLDEPFAGQDMRGCRLITDILSGLHQKGYTILVVTHNVGVIAEYARRVAVMDDGGVVTL